MLARVSDASLLVSNLRQDHAIDAHYLVDAHTLADIFQQGLRKLGAFSLNGPSLRFSVYETHPLDAFRKR